jgi:FdhD protein
LAKEFLVTPDPDDPRLSQEVSGTDHTGARVTTRVVTERALTLFLNAQEIVTMMTIGDRPDLLAVGYLLNQNMLRPDDEITGIDHDEDLGVVVVRTVRATDYEEKMKKKVRTSGCAQGTVFGDVMESFGDRKLSETATLRTAGSIRSRRRSTPRRRSISPPAPSMAASCARRIAARLHGGCRPPQRRRQDRRLDDARRRRPDDKIFYTTGRLTSEMVIKTVMMGIPILVSRSGFTAWGVELARRPI